MILRTDLSEPSQVPIALSDQEEEEQRDQSWIFSSSCSRSSAKISAAHYRTMRGGKVV
jgi:hypothetical protein